MFRIKFMYLGDKDLNLGQSSISKLAIEKINKLKK